MTDSKKPVKPEDFPPTVFDRKELDQIVDETWRRLAPLTPDQRMMVLRWLICMASTVGR